MATPCTRAILTPATSRVASVPLPFPAGTSLMHTGMVGRASIYTGFLSGSSALVSDVRNGLVDVLRAAGYVVGADPIAGGIASASFTGQRQGRLLVQPICRSALAVRYVVQQTFKDETPAASASANCVHRLDVHRLDEPLPQWLQLPGLTVLAEERAPGSTMYTSMLQGELGSVQHQTDEVVATYRRQGTSAERTSRVAGSSSLALVQIGGRAQALLVVRPLCQGHLVLQFLLAR